MMSEQAYLIVNMGQAAVRNGGWALSPFSGSPRFVHDDREEAERELLRLQKLNPRAELVLFESIAEAVPGVHDRGSLMIKAIAT